MKPKARPQERRAETSRAPQGQQGHPLTDREDERKDPRQKEKKKKEEEDNIPPLVEKDEIGLAKRRR